MKPTRTPGLLFAALENMITVRVDYAMGKDGSHAFYVGIGQAF